MKAEGSVGLQCTGGAHEDGVEKNLIRRRELLKAAVVLTGLGGFDLGCLRAQSVEGKGAVEYDNPYEGVDWERWETVHSMSHQHQGQTPDSLDLFHAMGYGHFAFSNYYPSEPTYPLHAAWHSAHPEIVASPNAEQHSFLDSGLHANSLGSGFSSGYGANVPAKALRESALVHEFEGLRVFSERRPWEGVYRLDLQLESKSENAKAKLSVEGASECFFREGFEVKGRIAERPLAAGKHTIYVRAESDRLLIRLEHDGALLNLTQVRLMQGSNRNWRDVFRAILDGESVDGSTCGGLIHKDGGGITLNHPTGKDGDYEAMLDFDARVLGIEVWNQLTSGFGSSKGFYAPESGVGDDHFYRLWDRLLLSGRRCWGFFVKDHNTYGRGRNVLLVPPLNALSVTEREAAVLRAYRRGTFFGAVSAIATNEKGTVVSPFDWSGFRFRRLALRCDAGGVARAIEVAVGGQDETQRPNVQIRLITDAGITAVIDAAEGEWELPRDAQGRPTPLFVRVEAIAYPRALAGGEALTAEKLRGMSVAQVAGLHDRWAERGATFFGNPAEVRVPIPVADLIFSQPIRRV